MLEVQALAALRRRFVILGEAFKEAVVGWSAVRPAEGGILQRAVPCLEVQLEPILFVAELRFFQVAKMPSFDGGVSHLIGISEQISKFQGHVQAVLIGVQPLPRRAAGMEITVTAAMLRSMPFPD